MIPQKSNKEISNLRNQIDHEIDHISFLQTLIYRTAAHAP